MNLPLRLLLADDADDNHHLVRAVAGAAGWHVDSVHNGHEAVEALRTRTYALVLMDIDMPVLDGYGAVIAIKENAGNQPLPPIIAFTALRMADPEAHFMARGMDGYLAKPFTTESLVAVLRQHAPESEESPQERLSKLLGVEPARALLLRFRDQLKTELDHIKGQDGRYSKAHSIGGLAGTLGFAALSAAWISVSEGNESALETARIASIEVLQALATLDDPAKS